MALNGLQPLSINPYYQSPYSSTGTSLPGLPSLGFPVKGSPSVDKVETSGGFGSQSATNVLDVRNPLSSLLGSFQGAAGSLANTPVNLGRINLSTNFAGPEAFQQGLKGGIDFFGQQGISEGLGNIALQRGTADAELQRTLGNDPGNAGLLSVLKNQNLFRSQLAGNPLISQAQKDTSGRVEQGINLQNQLTQLANQTKLQQLGFNQQAQLAELQSRLGLLQPQQNLLDVLSNLQGQQRGVQSTEQQILGRNFS